LIVRVVSGVCALGGDLDDVESVEIAAQGASSVMKSSGEVMDIIAAYREVGTYRGAAAMCGTTHKTVRRVIERQQAGGKAPAGVPRTRNYDVVAELVAEKVAATSGRISAKRLLPAARAAGYAGSARNFRRLVAAAKQTWRRGHHRGRRPAVWTPGEMLVIDWGDAGGGLHVFCAVLAWSRVRFVRFAGNERAEVTLGMLAECFEEIGGVPKVVLADRMGCLKGGVVANKVIPTADYVRFATHYGFRPDWCEAADPESKGIVENLVGYAKSDLVVPQAPFDDLTAANVAARQWCAEVNAVVHSEICAVPAERLAAERDLLSALPSLRPAIGKPPVTRKVDRLSCIRYGSARYSVPTRWIGARIAVAESAGRLLICDTATGEVIADHAPVTPGEASVADEHYGGPRPAPRRAARPRTEAEKAFLALGPAAEQWLTGSAASGNTRLAADLAEIAALRAAHGEAAIIAALQRAVTFRRWRAADVRAILAAGPGVPQPRPAGDALVLDLPAVPTRPLADYMIGHAAGHTMGDVS
jgi:transposase